MISNFMRIFLIVGALCNLTYVMVKINRSQIVVGEGVFWIWLSILIAIFGLFPSVPIFLAKVTKVESPVNLVYLLFIAILLLKTFGLSIKTSNLEMKLQEMNQRLALDNTDYTAKENG